MRLIIGLIRYGLTALFGILLSVNFAVADKQKHFYIKLTVFSLITLAFQSLCAVFFRYRFTAQIYPLTTHLPLVVFLVIAFKQTWLTAVVSVLSAYLCCQIPRWISAITTLFSDDKLYSNLLYIVAVFVSFALLCRYTVQPTQKLLHYSRQSAIIIGIIPFMYYLFDYSVTIYTDLLYSGHPFAVQFMPSVMASFYFFFLLIYYSRLEEQKKAQQERDLFSLQLRQSETELYAMRQIQEQTRQYRHDLRHHFALLLVLAEAEEIQKIKEYIRNVEEDLNTFTLPKHFCGNEVADLVLSHFDSQAANAGVKLLAKAELPVTLPLENTALCSLLSNGLENAILAASRIPVPEERTVSVRLCIRQRNLLLSIENPYTGDVNIVDGMPVAKQKGHGFGTRSIASIVQHHGGQISFSAQNNIFLMRVMLPLKE